MASAETTSRQFAASAADKARPGADAVDGLTPEQSQAIARAIAEPSRFAILQQIARSTCTMCSHLDAQRTLSPATISHHLKELHEAGLIESEREGRQMRLTLRRPVWEAYLAWLQQL